MKIVSLFSALVATLLLTGNIALAQGMMGGSWRLGSSSSVSSVQLQTLIAEIASSQGVSAQSQIDCSRVTDDQFERLGDASMDLMFANKDQHEAMDAMMGGEGSTSLRQAHITMGRSYLGCWSNYSSGPVFMPMMGGIGMMGGSFYPGLPGRSWNGYGGWPMHSYGSWSSLITMVLVWVLLGLGIAVLVKWLRKKK